MSRCLKTPLWGVQHVFHPLNTPLGVSNSICVGGNLEVSMWGFDIPECLKACCSSWRLLDEGIQNF